jgi:glycosyltransferase involved in cell wall biosynthesis
MSHTREPATLSTRPASAGPRVSIVMPVMNGERFLARSIASVRAQTLRDFELLLVDDGSTDGSTAVATAAARADPRVRLLRRPHEGVAAARNHALSVARAHLIALWDHDDLCHPERLAVQAAFLDAHPDVAVLGSWALYIGEDDRIAGVLEFGPCSADAYRALRREHLPLFSVASSTMFRLETARAQGGFRTALQPSEDTDLWTRIGDDHTVLILPRHLVAYRLHAGSASAHSFFRQRELNDLHEVNARRRRSGLPELAPAEYHRELQARPARERLRRARLWRSRYLYRSGGSLLAAGHARGALCLAAAGLLAPATVARRIKPQLAARMRRSPWAGQLRAASPPLHTRRADIR